MSRAVVRTCDITDEFAFFVPDRSVDVPWVLAVTAQAPPHVERNADLDLVHLLDRAVAGRAFNLSGLHVRLMREVHMIRQIMNLHPFNRFIVLKVLPQLGEVNRVFVCGVKALHLVVAVHADVGAGNRRMTALLNLRVTVLTLDRHLTGVQLVAERDRLLRGIACARRKALAGQEKNLT